MDIPPTQVFDDDDCPTQKISDFMQENEVQQVGVLSIGSDTYPIYKGINTIGRHPACKIVLNDQTVSKQHAEIEAGASQVSAWICDLNSSNKTKLNNLTLRSGRCYELKDGNVIHFGHVRAIYKVHRSLDDSVVPPTPAPSRQMKNQAIIPGTPDSSLNNSSTFGEVSTIPATQDDEERSVFRRPSLPQQRQSASSRSYVQGSSMDDSAEECRNFNVRRTGGKNVSISDTKVESTSGSDNEVDIHEMETQKICLASIRSNKQTDIHEMETQHDLGDVRELETQGKVTDIHDVETQRDITDIHDVETQGDMDDLHDTETQGGITNIHNVETQGNIIGIHDLETQHDIGSAHNNESRKSIKDIQDVETQNDYGNVRDIENGETEETEMNEEKSSMSDMETQKITVKETEVQTRDTDVRSNGSVNVDNVHAESSQKESQEILKLSLSSNFEEDDLELERSVNLLGSQDFLEDYIEDGAPMDETKAKASTPKKSPSAKDGNETIGKSTDDENIFDAATQVKDDDQNIFEAATQRVNYKLGGEVSSEDSETDEEGVFQRYSLNNREKIDGKAKKDQISDSEDSGTDEEGRFVEIAIKEKRAASSSFEVKQNESKELKNDPGSSKDSIDLFDVPTQRVIAKDKNTSRASLKKIETDTDKIDPEAPTQIINQVKETESNKCNERTDCKEMNIDDLAPTQIIYETKPALPRNNSSDSKANAIESNQVNEDITEMEDDSLSQILSGSKTDLNDGSPDSEQATTSYVKEPSVEDIDYEMAPTQLIGDIEAKQKERPMPSTAVKASKKSKSPKKVCFDDTLEHNLNEMFDDVNDERINDQSQLSTQTLEKVLQSTQGEEELSVSKSEVDTGVSTSKVKSRRGRKSKSTISSISSPLPDKNSHASNIRNTDTDSRNTEKYFSTLTLKRKYNVLSDAPDNVESVESTSPRRTEKHTSDARSNAVIEKNTEKANISEVVDDTEDDNTCGTPSRRRSTRNASTPKSLKKNKDRTPETVSQEVDVIEKKNESVTKESTSDFNAHVPSSSKTEQPEQSSKTLDDSDDDILAGLPEVRISGTLPYPGSPTSSTSSEYKLNVNRMDSKRGTAKTVSQKGATTRQSSRKIFIRRNSEDKQYHVISNADVDKISVKVNDDGETEKLSYKNSKKPAKKVAGDSRRSNTNEKHSLSQRKSVSSMESSDSRRNSPSLKTNIKTRNSSKESVDRSSVFQVENQAPVENVSNKTAKGKILNESRSGKRLPSPPDEMERKNDTKKRKADVGEDVVLPAPKTRKASARVATNKRQSASIVDFLMKRNSPLNREVPNTSNIPEESNLNTKAVVNIVKLFPNTPTEIEEKVENKIKRNRRTSVDSQASSSNTSISSNKKNIKNPVTEKAVERKNTRRQVKAKDISSDVGEESQEVEMIMRNTSIKDQSNHFEIEKNKSTDETAKSTRTRSTRKRLNVVGTETDTTDSSISSDLCESDNTQFEVPASRAKRAKISKKTSAKTRVDESSSSGTSSSTGNESVSSPSTRARRSMSSSFLSTSSPFKVKQKILFTGISNDYSKILTKLGASQVEDPAKCTVLVTDKVRRTVKFLCALAQSIPIVSIDWLNESGKVGHFVDLENYILKDPAAEAKFGFRLRASLEKAKERKLLEGYTIVLTPNVAPPPLPELKSIITSCGGKALIRPPTKWSEKTVIISREEDLANAKKFVSKAPKSVTIQSTEFLLTGILRQELDFVKYKLT